MILLLVISIVPFMTPLAPFYGTDDTQIILKNYIKNALAILKKCTKCVIVILNQRAFYIFQEGML